MRMETDKFPTPNNATSRYNSIEKVMPLLLPARVPDTFSKPLTINAR
jgi:hypothetical protein